MLVKEACERLWKKTCKPNRVLTNRVLSNRVLSNRACCRNESRMKQISNETNLVLSNRIVCNLYNKVNGRVYKSLC